MHLLLPVTFTHLFTHSFVQYFLASESGHRLTRSQHKAQSQRFAPTPHKQPPSHTHREATGTSEPQDGQTLMRCPGVSYESSSTQKWVTCVSKDVQ